MNITKRYLKQIIKEELTRALFERAMDEQQTDPDNPGMTQAPEEEESMAGGQTSGDAPMSVSGEDEEQAQQAQAKKPKKSGLSAETHKYRRYVNGLKKKGKIDQAGWKTLRRALNKIDMSDPQANKKFNQLMKQTITGGGEAAKGGGGSPGKDSKDPKFIAHLAKKHFGTYLGNSIDNPEIAAAYKKKFAALMQSPKIQAQFKDKDGTTNVHRMKQKIIMALNKMVAQQALP